MAKFEFPLAPLILGVVLGDQIKTSVVQAIMTDADAMMFFARPISGMPLTASIGSVISALFQHRPMQAKDPKTSEYADC